MLWSSRPMASAPLVVVKVESSRSPKGGPQEFQSPFLARCRPSLIREKLAAIRVRADALRTYTKRENLTLSGFHNRAVNDRFEPA